MDPSPRIGSIELLFGEPSDTAEFLKFVTTSDAIFVNTFEGVTGMRSGLGKKQMKKMSMDDNTSSYFLQSRIGTILCALRQLTQLGRGGGGRSTNSASWTSSTRARTRVSSSTQPRRFSATSLGESEQVGEQTRKERIATSAQHAQRAAENAQKSAQDTQIAVLHALPVDQNALQAAHSDAAKLAATSACWLS